jgi:hypothetical protein
MLGGPPLSRGSKMPADSDEAQVKEIAREAVSQAGFESCQTAEAEQAAKAHARQLAHEVLKFQGLEHLKAELDTCVDEEARKVARFS